MPFLTDDMYSSEQICIPPSFPYLLRQYAKAAIRTQPIDLLKWSTAYFRCLSLNIPPPVKPRLEYPIPRDFHGITPGWLKALIYQLQNNPTIPFKILWDRWMGACLKHHTLIQLLCLGGFDDPQAIPFLKFVALCAGTLSDDLTHTMILICEILTEEPEGGSAMIPLESFVSLYTFLAKIDASCGQTLRNYYFRDSLLSLWREKVEKEVVKEDVQEEVILETDESIMTKTSSETIEEEKEDLVDQVVSCPSLPEDDHFSADFLLKVSEPEEEECLEGEDYLPLTQEEGAEGVPVEEIAEKVAEREGGEGDEGAEEEKQEGEEGEEKEGEKKEEGEEEGEVKPEEGAVPGEKEGEATGEEKPTEEQKEGVQEPTSTADDQASLELKEYESVETITDQPIRDLDHVFEDDASLKEDLERLRALQQEMAGETDEELEKFKCRLIEEMPLTLSQEEGIKHFQAGEEKHDSDVSSEEKLKITSGEKLKSGDASSESQDVADEGEEKNYEEIYVEAIPGIGGVVPDDLISAVLEYMKHCSKNQHGTVMPRNIRHYNCPPLEPMDY